ncbi:hypothetical protein KSP39_PZI015823 [Platanthera zijinensis]|uniref:Uncharacterized protein n=1 Tax=Platanthera zijinensis TaxID=2320716 RepID=A0AAP0B927_9ASPA
MLCEADLDMVWIGDAWLHIGEDSVIIACLRDGKYWRKSRKDGIPLPRARGRVVIIGQLNADRCLVCHRLVDWLLQVLEVLVRAGLSGLKPKAALLPSKALFWFFCSCVAGLRADVCETETVCVPARLFGPSKADAVVPPVFAALVVAGSACIVRAVGLWDLADRDEEISYD